MIASRLGALETNVFSCINVEEDKADAQYSLLLLQPPLTHAAVPLTVQAGGM